MGNATPDTHTHTHTESYTHTHTHTQFSACFPSYWINTLQGLRTTRGYRDPVRIELDTFSDPAPAKLAINTCVNSGRREPIVRTLAPSVYHQNNPEAIYKLTATQANLKYS